MAVPAASKAAVIGALVIFIISVVAVILLVLVPTTLRFPLPHGRKAAVPIPHWIAPPIGALLMLAVGSLDGPSLLAGIRGDESIQPYAILILFLSLAYIAVALDQTGAFAWLALKMTKAANTGRKLFALHSLLSAALTVATGNDVVVMSLTPIVYIQATASGVDPIPYLTVEFVFANIWSMALYIGNPTNIIVASAFNMSFLEYSRWMLAPTVAAGLAAQAVLYALHRGSLPPRLTLPDINPRFLLSDPWGAVYGTVNLAVCLALLAAGPSLNLKLWVVTLACASATCCHNAVAYVLLPRLRGAARRRLLQGQLQQQGRSAAALLPHAADGAIVSGSSSRHAGAGSSGGQSDGQLGQTEGGGSGGKGVWGHNGVCLEAGDQLVVWAGEEAANGENGALAVAGDGVAEARHWQQQAQQQQQQQQRSSEKEQQPRTQMEQQQAEWQAPMAGLPVTAAMEAAPWPQQQPQVRRRSIDPHAPPIGIELAATATARSPTATAAASPRPPQPDATAGATATAAAAAAAAEDVRPRDLAAKLAPKKPTFWGPFQGVPWDVVPLVLGFFVLVEGLYVTGWVDRLGTALGSTAQGLASGLWAIGTVAVVLSNAVNNQPMTILLTRACLTPAFRLAAAAGGAVAPGVVQRNLRAALFTVVVGSNTAACFSVIGALAGIMWVAILRQRGFDISFLRFSYLMLPAGAAATVAALLVLWCEFAFAPF